MALSHIQVTSIGRSEVITRSSVCSLSSWINFLSYWGLLYIFTELFYFCRPFKNILTFSNIVVHLRFCITLIIATFLSLCGCPHLVGRLRCFLLSQDDQRNFSFCSKARCRWAKTSSLRASAWTRQTDRQKGIKMLDCSQMKINCSCSKKRNALFHAPPPSLAPSPSEAGCQLLANCNKDKLIIIIMIMDNFHLLLSFLNNSFTNQTSLW